MLPNSDPLKISTHTDKRDPHWQKRQTQSGPWGECLLPTYLCSLCSNSQSSLAAWSTGSG